MSASFIARHEQLDSAGAHELRTESRARQQRPLERPSVGHKKRAPRAKHWTKTAAIWAPEVISASSSLDSPVGAEALNDAPQTLAAVTALSRRSSLDWSRALRRRFGGTPAPDDDDSEGQRGGDRAAQRAPSSGADDEQDAGDRPAATAIAAGSGPSDADKPQIGRDSPETVKRVGAASGESIFSAAETTLLPSAASGSVSSATAPTAPATEQPEGAWRGARMARERAGGRGGAATAPVPADPKLIESVRRQLAQQLSESSPVGKRLHAHFGELFGEPVRISVTPITDADYVRVGKSPLSAHSAQRQTGPALQLPATATTTSAKTETRAPADAAD